MISTQSLFHFIWTSMSSNHLLSSTIQFLSNNEHSLSISSSSSGTTLITSSHHSSRLPDVLKDVFWYTCTCAYGLFALVLLLHFFACFSRVKRQSKLITLFFLCLQLSISARLGYFIYLLVTKNVYMSEEYRVIQFSFDDITSLLFLCAYMILCLHWFSIYYSIRKRYYEIPQERFMAWKYNLILFLCFGLIMCLALALLSTCHILLNYYSHKTPDSQVYKWIVICSFFPILTFVSALTFSIVAMKLYTEVVLNRIKVHENHKKLKRVGILTGSCLIWLFFQKIVHIFVSVPHVRSLIGPVFVPLLDLAYFILMELIPNLIVAFSMAVLFHKSICEPLIWKEEHHGLLESSMDEVSSKAYRASKEYGSYILDEDSDLLTDDSTQVRLYTDIM